MTRFIAQVLMLLIGIFASAVEAPRLSSATSAPAATNLPIILLEVKEPIVSDPKVACTVRMILPPGMMGNTGTVSGLVRIHGGVSQGYPKKSYGLTLETPAQWLGMRESAHWVLNAAFVDRSLMRHKLSYDLFRSLSAAGGKHYSAESRRGGPSQWPIQRRLSAYGAGRSCAAGTPRLRQQCPEPRVHLQGRGPRGEFFPAGTRGLRTARA